MSVVHGPVPSTWFGIGRWATCACGFDPHDTATLNRHWLQNGFKVHDDGGTLVVTEVPAVEQAARRAYDHAGYHGSAADKEDAVRAFIAGAQWASSQVATGGEPAWRECYDYEGCPNWKYGPKRPHKHVACEGTQ